MNEKRTFPLGQLSGLKIRATPSAVGAALLMAGGFVLFLLKVLKWRPWTAITGGILAAAIHYLSELWHHVGHARAAEETGFLMKGVTFSGPIAVSVYPDNEGLLTAETHIQRALGGPIFSLLLTIAAGLAALLFRPLGGLPLFLTVFAFLDNLLVLTIGALLPLGFTDGSTLLTWWNQRQSRRHIPIG